MTKKTAHEGALAGYQSAVPPPAAPIYSRWRTAPDGRVTRELMPSFLGPRASSGYALKDSPEDAENERTVRGAAQAPTRPPAQRRTFR